MTEWIIIGGEWHERACFEKGMNNINGNEWLKKFV